MNVQQEDRNEMSQRERDPLKVLHGAKDGQNPQANAAQVSDLTTRQVRRLQVGSSTPGCVAVCCASIASRTPAEPYPPVGESEDTKKGPHRPRAVRPWRRGFKKRA